MCVAVESDTLFRVWTVVENMNVEFLPSISLLPVGIGISISLASDISLGVFVVNRDEVLAPRLNDESLLATNMRLMGSQLSIRLGTEIFAMMA